MHSLFKLFGYTAAIVFGTIFAVLAALVIGFMMCNPFLLIVVFFLAVLS